MGKLKKSDAMIVNRILLGTGSIIFWMAVIQGLFVRSGGEVLRGLILVTIFLLPLIPTLMLASYSMFIKISRGVITLQFEYEVKDTMKWAVVALSIMVNFVVVVGGVGLIIAGYPWVGIGFLVFSTLISLFIAKAARSAVRKLLDPAYLRVDWDIAKTRKVFRASIMVFLEGTFCSALGAAGTYFVFWPQQYLIAGLFFASMVFILWHFRRATRSMIRDLGFPSEVRVS